MTSESMKTFVRSRQYLFYLIMLMGLVAIMDQYLSTIKTTAIPYILREYFTTVNPEEYASVFSFWEGIYLIPTFFIFLLNGLNDIIGRKKSIFILVLIMGFSSLAMVYLTPSFHMFMVFYGIAMFTTVSNMWTFPIGEEAPAAKRAKYVSIVYIIGLIPLQALLPPILIDVLGVHWKWMYGVMFLMMIPVLILWMFMKETGRYERIKKERQQGKRKKHWFGLGVINKSDVRYILFSAAIWICWLTNSFFFFMAGTYFQEIHDYSLTNWSILLLVTLIFAMIGGVTSGRYMDKIGRTKTLIIGSLGLALSLSFWGFIPINILPIFPPIAGFFISFSYTWIVVYIPEIFPTERRGSCMGWTTTIARVSYVGGPMLASVMLVVSPMMEWFWVAAGLIMLIPVVLLYLFKPYETQLKELEDIEKERIN